MILHKFNDGSEGYEWELGDPVYIADCIAYGSWLRSCVGGMGTVEKISFFKTKSYMLADVDVRYSSEWGPASCFAYHLLPTPETKITREIAA